MVQHTLEPMNIHIMEKIDEPINRILHIDDEMDFLVAARQILETQGPFEVETATSVNEGKKKMEKETFDAIICDYMMPRKDGLEFLRELRQGGNNIPFIIFTGKSREEIAIEALNLGADRYFSKIGGPATVYGELTHGLNQILEKRKTMEKIGESEEELRSIFDAAVDGIAYVSRSGRIIAANRKLVEEMLGYTMEETIGGNLATQGRISTKDFPRVLKALTEVITTGKPIKNFEVVLIRKDGHRIPVEISTGVVRKEGKITGVITIVRDVSKHRVVEEELKESRKHFQTLFNAMADPVVIVDRKGKFLEITNKVKEITGFTRDELLGKNFLRTKIVTTKSKAILIKNLAKRMIGKHISPYEVEVLTKDGRQIPYEINATKIKFRNKQADLVVFRDVSERNKALERLSDLNEKLSVVGKLTRHDVGNKLSIIKMSAFLAKQKLPYGHEITENLNQIEVTCEQVGRILNFTKIYEKIGSEELSYIDVEKAFEEAVTLTSNLHNVKIINSCNNLSVLADSLLRQLFYNLIDNSLKHGKKVRQISINSHWIEKDRLQLVYEDDGVGLSKTDKKKIFTKGYGKGTGYGLYLIKRMCDVYGWTINETGIQGRGAKFTITIPKAHVTPAN